jgi:microcystin-dependent protein
MTYNVSLNGTPFPLPSQSERNWSAQVNAFFVAIGQTLLQKSGGSFSLTAEVDFGAAFGLSVAYLKSKTAGSGGIAAAGWQRLSRIDRIAWRNLADTADIPLGLNQTSGRFQAGVAFQFYADAGTDVLNLQPLSAEKNSGRIPSVGERVMVQSFAGTGLTVGATYWVTDVAGYTIKLYTTEGGPTYADITGAGLGYLVIQDDVMTSASADTMKNKTAFDLAYDSETGTISGNSINTTSGKVIQRITVSDPELHQINQPTAGKLYVFVNETASDITIKHNTGTATRTIYTPGGVDVTWKVNAAMTFLYDSGLSAWVLVGGSSGGSGSGSGEINGVSNPSGAENANGWTGATRDTTNSPLAPIVSTCLAISNAATAETSTSGGHFPISSLATGLRSRRLKVEFYYSTPATDNYAVSVYRGSTRIPLTTDTSGATNLPANSIGKFYAEFDADSSASSYTASVTRTSGSTGPAYITNVIIGPGLQVQGPMVGKWQSYVSGSSVLPAGLTTEYMQLGQNCLIRVLGENTGTSASQWVIGLPSGATIQGTYDVNQPMEGFAEVEDSVSSGVVFHGVPVYASSTTIRVKVSNEATNALWGNTTPVNFAANTGYRVVLQVSLTISEWSGGTVSLLNQNTQSPIKAGIIMPFAGATVPTGWLECDGSTYAQTLYPQLYATLGSTWATCTNPLSGSAYSAPTAGNFRVPDLRGTFLRGTGTFSDGIGTDTTLAGYQADQMQGHYHKIAESGSGGAANPSAYLTPTNGLVATNSPGTELQNWKATDLVTDGTNGTPRTGKETRPRNVGVKYIIKAWDESFNLAGFFLANGNSSGMVAPRKGQYSLTVTSSMGGWSTIRAVGIYYQDQDGNHRLKFNISGFITSTSYSSASFGISGVTFKNLSNFYQPCAGMSAGTNPGSVLQCFANPGTSNVNFSTTSGTGISVISLSGDVELESKPTWA